MTEPKLLVRKRLLVIQGKKRPTCFIQAVITPDQQAVLEEHFFNEALFKRASYSTSWPAGTVAIPAPIAPHVASFLKNDACPEITVKTMLAGQLYQGSSIWDTLSFELIAKVAFDNFCAILAASTELDREVLLSRAEVLCSAKPVADFDADTLLELRALGAHRAAA